MNLERLKVSVRGVVQGVGFRPFVYRLASELGLRGWVLNSAQGVFIEVEGDRQSLQNFLFRVETDKPQLASIHSLEPSFLDAIGYDRFEIRDCNQRGPKTVLVMPDVATCSDCLREILDPTNRRYRYPFTNCTNCGPRFTIIESLPYDRPNTSMARFGMCPECLREYSDPMDRRFHAQPIACPNCGPQLELLDSEGHAIAQRDGALHRSVEAILKGKVVAIKGLGGFQLVVDARNEAAVRTLRLRKHREEKPFALLYPSLDAVRDDCKVSGLEERLLLSPESPIVLLDRRKHSSRLAPSIAPVSGSFGVMLPYTPLHHLLMREICSPIVATSGNLRDEPICIDEREALERLNGIAEFFLVHDRPIVRHMDDSIVRIICGSELVLRRARGYAPLPLHVREPLPTILALGAHLKNSVALSVGKEVFVSQHIGDLETSQAFAAFQRVASDLQDLYGISAGLIACDLHPDYLSTKHARHLTERPVFVQHHWAHVLACIAENELNPPVLGVAWDGTGYGTNGAIWGGEFLLTTGTSFERVAHFREFRLPGGNAAVKEPRRTALGLLYEAWGEDEMLNRGLVSVREFAPADLAIVRQMLARRVNSPVTSSVGRLFDAIASIVGLRQRVSFEGQAAMELEYVADQSIEESYLFQLKDGSPVIVDWEPMLNGIAADVDRRQSVGVISAKFHNTLVETIVEIARRVGVSQIALTGGCFQNRYLTERAVRRLKESGFKPYRHQRIPANDGGIAVGQVVAARILEKQDLLQMSPVFPYRLFKDSI
jgi:hydrogenase maturation protein HypF